MANHKQKPHDSLFVCASCKKNECHGCVDGLRKFYSTIKLCKCGRDKHTEEIMAVTLGSSSD